MALSVDFEGRVATFGLSNQTAQVKSDMHLYRRHPASSSELSFQLTLGKSTLHETFQSVAELDPSSAKIGSGGFGAVYQAKLGNYEVAVKVVDTSDEWDKFKFDNYDGKEDVHVPIMPLLATGFMDRLSRNSPQCYALLMPRAERSLYSLWETNLSSKDEAMWSLRAARDGLEAIKFLGKQRRRHADLKSLNLLVWDDRIFVADGSLTCEMEGEFHLRNEIVSLAKAALKDHRLLPDGTIQAIRVLNSVEKILETVPGLFLDEASLFSDLIEGEETDLDTLISKFDQFLIARGDVHRRAPHVISREELWRQVSARFTADPVDGSKIQINPLSYVPIVPIGAPKKSEVARTTDAVEDSVEEDSRVDHICRGASDESQEENRDAVITRERGLETNMRAHRVQHLGQAEEPHDNDWQPPPTVSRAKATSYVDWMNNMIKQHQRCMFEDEDEDERPALRKNQVPPKTQSNIDEIQSDENDGDGEEAGQKAESAHQEGFSANDSSSQRRLRGRRGGRDSGVEFFSRVRRHRDDDKGTRSGRRRRLGAPSEHDLKSTQNNSGDDLHDSDALAQVPKMSVVPLGKPTVDDRVRLERIQSVIAIIDENFIGKPPGNFVNRAFPANQQRRRAEVLKIVASLNNGATSDHLWNELTKFLPDQSTAVKLYQSNTLEYLTKATDSFFDIRKNGPLLRKRIGRSSKQAKVIKNRHGNLLTPNRIKLVRR